jgi:signal transduction histidine kinase
MKIIDLLNRNPNAAPLTQEMPGNSHLPNVRPQQTIIEAYHLMKAHNQEFLPVYDDQKFVGTVTLSKITDRLVTIVGENKQNYQRAIHDLRNPLFNLQGLVNLLIETTEVQENLDLLNLCNLSCKHAMDILEDLLYVEIDESKPLNLIQTEMNYFYGECVKEQIGLAFLKNIKIVTEFSTESVIRNVDRSQLKRAVQNVISNAIKFSFPQGVIKISSKIEDEKLIFKIVDAGIGIPEHLQSEVFNKFTKAQRPGTGGEASTGLGLCFSRQCFGQHNGTIYFKSEEGKGTKFYIVM